MADLFRSKEDCFNVEVNQLTHDNATAVTLWCGGVEVTEYDALNKSKSYAGINVPTSTGMKRAQEGDWIVRQLIGDFIVVNAAEFAEKYEALT